jgi:short-subunit dehydrogenase
MNGDTRLAPVDLFQGTWALVTGASSGIGEEFARQLAAKRANLILTARNEQKLRQLGRELIQRAGVQTRVVPIDLTRAGGTERLCIAVDALGLVVDHVVNNAGFGAAGKFHEGDEQRLADMVRLNCEAVTVLSRHFLPGMRERGRGGIINVASTAAFQPVPYMAVYGATKAFVVSLSAAMHEEARGSGVRVMALCPGPVPTGFQAAAGVKLDVVPGQAITAMTAGDTVRRALEAYADRKDVCVPGTANSIGAVASKVLPRGLVVRAMAELMRRGGRS